MLDKVFTLATRTYIWYNYDVNYKDTKGEYSVNYCKSSSGDVVFDGDLKAYLLDKGVSEEHITQMQNKEMQVDRGAYYKCSGGATICLVPLSKVSGTYRSTVGKSVYENVRSIDFGKRAWQRFVDCIDFLEKMSLDELYDSYQNLSEGAFNSLPRFTYYVEDDDYFLSGDGNHRTLTAMLVGAPTIKAKVVSAHCEPEKRRNWFEVDGFFRKYGIRDVYEVTPIFGFGSQGKDASLAIVFFDDDGEYIVRDYLYNPGDSCSAIIEKLEKQIVSDRKKAQWLNKIPDLFHPILQDISGLKRAYYLIHKDREINGRLNCKMKKMQLYDIDTPHGGSS